jgi:pimeloyl-ACP methyl ester carboxylesterase
VFESSDGVASDIRGLSRLVIEAAIGVTGIAEHTHRSILHLRPFAPPPERGAGVTGFVYRCVKGVMRLSGAAIEMALAQFGPLLDRIQPSPSRDAMIAALNGVLGDHLVQTENSLALPMRLRRDGQNIAPDAAMLATLAPTGRIVVLIHGLCVSDLQWRRNGHDHGERLAQRLGFTPIYLFYNSGLHISQNGQALSELLEEMVDSWPVPIESLAVIGHSMGGLVARSACHHAEDAGHEWRRRLEKLICLGTPHHGAPLERIGAWIDLVIARIPFAAAFSRLGGIRSAGIADLRHGSLIDEDWRGRDPLALSDARRPIPLPADVACFAIAATTSATAGGLNDRLVGDGLVTVASALGRHSNPARDLGFAPERQWVGCGMNHFDLLDRAEVYEKVESWLAP